MNLGGKRLDAFLESPPGRARERTRLLQFAESYRSIVRRAGPIHDTVVAGAALAEGERRAYLTGHGRKHVDRVIERATDLLLAKGVELEAAEIFALLVSIQAHDVGNIEGRDKHEERIAGLLPDIVGDDITGAIERLTIRQIVRAHGGEEEDGSKDRIGRLNPQPAPVFGGKVRLQLLAAILRFADELADDESRAAVPLLERNLIPEGSEANHQYAFSLKSVDVNVAEHEANLQFVIPPDLATRTVGRCVREVLSPVYLIDYIFERMEKMHIERIYCSRFLTRDGIRVDRINAELLFLDNLGSAYHAPIRYRMHESGYPKQVTIDEVCGDDDGIRDRSGFRWTGERLKASVEQVQRGGEDV